MKLTGASFEDRFLITEIEVYRVYENYNQAHFQAEKIGYFKTEKDLSAINSRRLRSSPVFRTLTAKI